MASKANLRGLRVLVVEDEMMVSLLIEDILGDEGCVIIGPHHRIESALQAARTEMLDLAVLDMNLAGVLVFPVAEALAERKIPFLFLSGYGPGGVPAGHPNWRICSKPFTGDALVTALLKVVTAQD